MLRVLQNTPDNEKMGLLIEMVAELSARMVYAERNSEKFMSNERMILRTLRSVGIVSAIEELKDSGEVLPMK